MGHHVDRDLLGSALTNHTGTACYLVRTTGEVIPDLDGGIDADDDERYVRIIPLPSRLVFERMQAFAEDVADQRLKERLCRALEGKGAFRRFKDLLADHPAVERDWFQAHDRWLDQQVEDWLETHGLKA